MVTNIGSLPVSPVPAREAAVAAPGPLAAVRQAEQFLDMPLTGDAAACEQVARWIADLNRMPAGSGLLRQIRRHGEGLPGAELHISAGTDGPRAGSIIGQPAGPRAWILRLSLLSQTPEGRQRSPEGAAAALLVALNGLLDKDRAHAEGTYRDEPPLACRLTEFLPAVLDWATARHEGAAPGPSNSAAQSAGGVRTEVPDNEISSLLGPARLVAPEEMRRSLLADLRALASDQGGADLLRQIRELPADRYPREIVMAPADGGHRSRRVGAACPPVWQLAYKAWAQRYVQSGMDARAASTIVLASELRSLAALPRPDTITEAPTHPAVGDGRNPSLDALAMPGFTQGRDGTSSRGIRARLAGAVNASEASGTTGAAAAARKPYMRVVPSAARIPTASRPPAAAAAMAASVAATAAGAGAAGGARPSPPIHAGPYLQPQLAAVADADTSVAPNAGARHRAPDGQVAEWNPLGVESLRRLMQVPAGLAIASEVELRAAEITALDKAREEVRIPNEIGLSLQHTRLIAMFDALCQLLIRADQAAPESEAIRGLAQARPTLDAFRLQLGCPMDPREAALRAWQENLNAEPRAFILADELRRTMAAGEPPPDPRVLGLPPFPDMSTSDATGNRNIPPQHWLLAAVAGRI